MLSESFSGIRILAWFLEHPTKKIHFRELCRELKLGPLTVKTYCEEFLKHEWIREERNANLRVFSLNDENYVVRAMKRAYFLKKAHGARIEELVDNTALSLALYGSHASGEYDEKSDIDLIVIGRRENVNYERVEKLKKALGKSVQVTVFSLGEWEKRKKNDPFALSVLRNNVLVGGVPL